MLLFEVLLLGRHCMMERFSNENRYFPLPLPGKVDLLLT